MQMQQSSLQQPYFFDLDINDPIQDEIDENNFAMFNKSWNLEMKKIAKIMDLQVRKSMGKRATKRMRKSSLKDVIGYIRTMLENPMDEESKEILEELYRYKKILQDEVDPDCEYDLMDL